MSIRARMIVAVGMMTAILGVVAYMVSGQLATLSGDLAEFHDLQDVKTHIMAPQKDMNQFIAAIDGTLLWVDLGKAEEAQSTFDGGLDAEQDISGEFAWLEENATGKMLPIASQAHKDWETATEFMKIRAVTAAKDKGITLVYPAVEPTKAVDAHTDEAISGAQSKYGALTSAELAAISENDDVNPVETADVAIDGADEKVTETLDASKASAEASLAKTRQLTLFGLLAALLGVVLVGVIATVSIVGPLDRLKNGAQKIAEGDLDYHFGSTGADEIGVVTKTVEEMAHSLKTRIANLEEVAGIVVLTSDEISAEALSGSDANLGGIAEKADMMKALVSQALPKK